MSSVRTLEQVLLARANHVLDEAARAHVGPLARNRAELLEAVSSRIGGWDLNSYRSLSQREFNISTDSALRTAAPLLAELRSTPIPAALALSSLGQPELAQSQQRASGAYYTDFRLAQYLTKNLPDMSPASLIVDAACGTGILLTAATMATCGEDQVERTRMIRESVCGSDLSADALRAACLSLASLTDDLTAVQALIRRLRVADSLIGGADLWRDIAPDGFDIVLGNPPWEKVKVSRHEFLLAAGMDRHYGDDYALETAVSTAAITTARTKAARYALTLNERYPLAGSGEPDLYKAFFELSLRLAHSDGQIGLLVPAGLIRSQGTEGLRRHLLAKASGVEITVIENRSRFFSIDTRFKFLVVRAQLSGSRRSAITLQHARGTDDLSIDTYGVATINRTTLAKLRPDLTIPEVRSDQEWRLFRRMADGGETLGSSRGWWIPRIVREVDMTRDRKKFERTAGQRLPLVEGRMVHQYRSGAKSYVTGTGRRATWAPNPAGKNPIDPQFWIAANDLPRSAVGRHEGPRVGFCDVTGQTNERTILATIIPSGVICGNKVPTITFDGAAGSHPDALHLWVAVANSLAFDWMARRVVTTTVNFFLLLGLPFPALTPDGLPARRIAALSREIVAAAEGSPPTDSWALAEHRAELDVLVASAYGLGTKDLGLILDDFPLLDRGQPPLAGETRSTVTRDLVLAKAAVRFDATATVYEQRVDDARQVGAIPYIPAEYSGLNEQAGLIEA